MGLDYVEQDSESAFYLSMPSDPAEHCMVCWTSVQYPYRLCVTGLLLTTILVCVVHSVPLAVLCICMVYLLCLSVA